MKLFLNKMEPEVQVTSTKDNYLFETFSHLRASSANKIQLNLQSSNINPLFLVESGSRFDNSI